MTREINFPEQFAIVMTSLMKRQLRNIVRNERDKGNVVSMSDIVRRAVRKEIEREMGFPN